MQTFLQEVAADLIRRHKQLEKLVVVFPNRRAIIYFRKHLAALLTRPAFAPRLLTIEEFFAGFTSRQVPDRLLLIQRLYDAYNEVVHRAGADREPFDKFYFWGDMLLRDFEEIDKYRVPAEQLFKDLTVQKELDETFDFLTEEQRDFLQQFWSGFATNVGENKKKFLAIWHRLLPLYRLYRQRLSDEGLAYEGMLQRTVVEGLATGAISVSAGQSLAFAGFNALTKTEEALISYCVSRHQAEVFWDTDAYYVNNNVQEAGRFFREYQRHDVLGQTFTHQVPSHLLDKVRSLGSGEPVEDGNDRGSAYLYGAPDPVSQAKLMSVVLSQKIDQGLEPEETVIVLPDEKLLLPVLHGLPPVVEKLNVTMGFPLSATPMFNLAELLVDLQIARRDDHFNFRQVLSLLGHPYVVAANFADANQKRKDILRNNWIMIPAGFLATTEDIHRQIFAVVEATDVVEYLRRVTIAVGSLASLSDLEREYAFHFLTLLNRMEEVMARVTPDLPSDTANGKAARRKRELKSFLRLLTQLIHSNKIPFSGEPLRGLQIMGLLETRSLDYKNVFVLSLNEGSLPASGQKGSFIPHNIRKAYGLPTAEHQDAIYAYLFFRVLQRAKHIFLFYNTETDVLGQGEMSRYLQQLIYESGIRLQRTVLHNTIRPRPVDPISIPKSAAILETLATANAGNAVSRGISPSALNTYLECRLRYYLRYVAKIREADEVEEDLDARILGNLLHGVMEMLYTNITARKQSRQIEAADLKDAEAEIDALIDRVFITTYHLNPDAPVEYAGQRVVVREVVRRIAMQIVNTDRSYAPFTIKGMEQGGLYHEVKLSATRSVLVSGKIDRVDWKEGVVRIIDYKTGKDQLDFDTIESLFVRDGKRNKAAFQTLLYALLYHVNSPGSDRIVPGLINRVNLFDKEFQFGLKMGSEVISDGRLLFEEFEARLGDVLRELYLSDTPFDQTPNTDVCKFCEFKEICYR